MASLIKHRGRYYAQFYDAGRKPRQKQVALKTKTKRVSERLARKLEDDYALGEFDPWRDDPHTYRKKGEAPKSIGQARDLFIECKRGEDKSVNTINSYRWLVGGLADRVGEELPTDSLSSEHITAYVTDSSVSKSTRHARYRHVRAFVRWCRREGVIRHDPLDGAEPPDRLQKLPKSMTEGELRKICEALRADYSEKRVKNHCRPGELVWHIPLFKFAYATGMRMSELARLRWGHLDFSQRLLFIYEQKNKKEQTIPLTRKAIETLRGIERGDNDDFVFRSPRVTRKRRSTRRFVEHASRTFKEARENAGINRKLTPHCLRHSFCTRIAEAGKSAVLIKEAARHADIQTSMLLRAPIEPAPQIGAGRRVLIGIHLHGKGPCCFGGTGLPSYDVRNKPSTSPCMSTRRILRVLDCLWPRDHHPW